MLAVRRLATLRPTLRPTLHSISASAVVALVATTIAVVIGPADDRVDAAATSTVTCVDVAQTTPPPPAELDSYQALQPVPRRIVDTRKAIGGHAGVVPAGCTLRLDLATSVVPTHAGAAALSVTALSSERGHVTVFPCASGRPVASSLNTRDDSPTPNLVVAVPDAARQVCLYAHVDLHLVVDVQGWWGDGANRFVPVEPVRALDTRRLPGRPPLPAYAVRDLRVAGVHVPADATAIVVNLTVTEPVDEGWLAAYPCGEAPPETSNLNYVRADTRAVAAIVGVGFRNGGQGSICLRTMTTTHVVVDVVGYYAPAPSFGPAATMRPQQQRIVDTRNDVGPWDRPFRAGEVRELDPLVGVAGADDVTAVVINAIGLDADSSGYLTFFPCTEPRPVVSSVNTLPGREATNLLTVKLSRRGTLCVYSFGPAEVVLDLVATMSLPDGSPVQSFDVVGAATYPPFSVDGHDYAVECGPGTNTLRVAARPHRSYTVALGGQPIDALRSATIDVEADDTFTVVAAAPGGTERRYHFRCLPADFPDVTVDRPGDPAPGWYLTGLGGSGTSGAFAVIFDERGAPVWYRRTPRFPVNVQRLTDGTILYDPADRSGYGSGAEETAFNIDLDGTVLRQLTTDDPSRFPIDHHELLERSDGWTMVAYELVDDVDLRVLGPSFGEHEYGVDGWIREMPAGPDQWVWRTSDHFGVDEVQFPVRFRNFLPDDPLGEVDLFHLNSIEQVEDGSGDYVVSARHLDAVFRIDHASGALDWILSSVPTDGVVVPNLSGAPRLAIIGDPYGGPRRQHDARLDGDVLTLFDNRTGTGEPARAVAYRIDDTAMTATLLWQILEPEGRSSGGLGGLRIGTDGSRLITWGALQPSIEEYDASGTLAFSIGFAPGNAYRVVKYAPDDFDLTELRATAGSVLPPASSGP